MRRVQAPRADVAPPLTWEIPAVILGGWLVLAAVALPAGQAAASFLGGGGPVWPDHALIPSVAGLLAGRPGEGLSGAQTVALPPDWVVYGVVGALEIGVLALAVMAAILCWRTVGPGAQFGLARRHDVEAAIGPRALWSRRRTVRPDLYPPRRRRSWRRVVR